MLHAGQNTITITMDSRKMVSYLMVDYLRSGIDRLHAACARERHRLCRQQAGVGVLAAWFRGDSYNILRSTAGGADYVPICDRELIGPVCGSGRQQSDLYGQHGRQWDAHITMRCSRSTRPGTASTRRPAPSATPSPKLVRERAARAGGIEGHRARAIIKWRLRWSRLAGGELLQRLAHDAPRRRRRRHIPAADDSSRRCGNRHELHGRFADGRANV